MFESLKWFLIFSVLTDVMHAHEPQTQKWTSPLLPLAVFKEKLLGWSFRQNLGIDSLKYSKAL